jgi:phosphatidylglycerol:prolipoprotein diacylglycerol transferase
MSYIPFPPLSPELFSVEVFGVTLALRWYALAYIVGLVAGWGLIRQALRRPRLWAAAPPMTEDQLERLLTGVIVGVILGGRIGYAMFYGLTGFLDDPLRMFRVWEGGMAFHGGFLGVVIAGLWFCQREGISRLSTGDLMAMVAPIGLFLGRLANFINAELWGRTTDVPWSFVFPGAGPLPRHPSQLYEATLEGLVLFIVLAVMMRGGALKRPGTILGAFCLGYGLARTVCEFFREPDAQLGFLWGPLTMGMLLSLPLMIAGVMLIMAARRAKPLQQA